MCVCAHDWAWICGRCIHIHACVSMCVCVYVSMYVCVFVNINMCAWLHMCVYVLAFVCVCVCVCVCVRVCVCVCISVFVLVYVPSSIRIFQRFFFKWNIYQQTVTKKFSHLVNKVSTISLQQSNCFKSSTFGLFLVHPRGMQLTKKGNLPCTIINSSHTRLANSWKKQLTK